MELDISSMPGHEAEAAKVLLGVANALIALYVLGIVICILQYVLQSLGTYTIAKRRGIAKPWLAWIPVLNVWTLGSIGDQYQSFSNGKNTNRRKWLLGLAIASAVLIIVLSVAAVQAVTAMIASAPNLSEMSDQQIAKIILPMVSKLIEVGVFVFAISITNYVIRCIALYSLYSSCGTRNSVMYLVLGILFPIATPFFIFASNGKTAKHRKWLLGLAIASAALIMITLVVAVQAVAALIASAPNLIARILRPMVSKLIWICFCAFVISVTSYVFRCIALHSLYSSCAPNNSEMYLVLGILFPITTPFFIFACRNKDLGMPHMSARSGKIQYSHGKPTAQTPSRRT